MAISERRKPVQTRWHAKLGPLVALVLIAAVVATACAGDDSNAAGSTSQVGDQEQTATTDSAAPSSQPTAVSSSFAPDFTLPDATGQPVSLETLLKENPRVVIVFYRGFF